MYFLELLIKNNKLSKLVLYGYTPLIHIRRRGSGGAEQKQSNEKASVPQSAGTGANGMLRFYTEDAPGLIMYVQLEFFNHYISCYEFAT